MFNLKDAIRRKTEDFETAFNRNIDTEALKEEVDKFKEYAERESKKLHVVPLIGGLCIAKVARTVTKEVLDFVPEKKKDGMSYKIGETALLNLVTINSGLYSYKEIEKWREKLAYISRGDYDGESND